LYVLFACNKNRGVKITEIYKISVNLASLCGADLRAKAAENI